jgi:hypothetical protein
MIEFIPSNRYDDEVLELFKDYRHIFPLKCKKTVKKQISWLVKSCLGHFYKVYYDYKFIGCIWFYDWNDEDKIVEFGGFGKRGNFHKVNKICKLICDRYIEKCGYTIYSKTDILAAKISLLKSGFIKIKEGVYKYGRS